MKRGKINNKRASSAKAADRHDRNIRVRDWRIGAKHQQDEAHHQSHMLRCNQVLSYNEEYWNCRLLLGDPSDWFLFLVVCHTFRWFEEDQDLGIGGSASRNDQPTEVFCWIRSVQTSMFPFGRKRPESRLRFLKRPATLANDLKQLRMEWPVMIIVEPFQLNWLDQVRLLSRPVGRLPLYRTAGMGV